MTSKKGQVTMFIIIGMIVLIIASAIFYIRYYKGSDYTPPQMNPISKYVTACLQDTAEGAVLLAGAQGGVIYFGDVIPNVETSYSYSSYWYDEGQDVSISKEFVENEIRVYIEEEIIPRCIKNFEDLHMNIAAGEISSAEVSIKPGYIDITLNMPVTLIEGDQRTTISKFSTQLPVKLGQAITIANKVVQMEIKDPNNVRISELGDMDMMVAPYKYTDDIMIYSIIDENNKVKGINFKLIFANRFGNESSGNRAPKIVNPNNLLLVEGNAAEYQFVAFDADNDKLTWHSTGMDVVDSKGMFRFTPSAADVGETSIDVIVEDGKGGRDSQTIKVLVVSK
ncbi:MAG: hypothetical protein NT001_02585 [Candidatus Woesearchaeota archaeon]|nr:hypothetical protein [Candidatus Woesearchaeota archaeon]